VPRLYVFVQVADHKVGRIGRGPAVGHTMMRPRHLRGARGRRGGAKVCRAAVMSALDFGATAWLLGGVVMTFAAGRGGVRGEANGEGD
jgi:hypothetical protein